MNPSIIEETLPARAGATAGPKNFRTALNPFDDQGFLSLTTNQIRGAVRLLRNAIMSRGETALQFHLDEDEVFTDGAGIWKQSNSRQILVSAQKAANPPTKHPVQAGDTLSEIAQASATACSALLPRDPRPAPISLSKILHYFKTSYRLARERYRQRKQLMEMDDRQLKDIGITPEQAEWEARKPIWKD